jgi:hypothetical protein
MGHGGRTPTGTGMHLNHDGYLRIHRGPLRGHMAHRAYANRQFRMTYGRDLPPGTEIHHLCRNRTCFPPSDYHLLILDSALHHAIDAGRSPNNRFRHRNQKSFHEVSEFA